MKPPIAMGFSEHSPRLMDASLNGIMIFRSVKNPASEIVDFEWQWINSPASQIMAQPDDQLVGKRLLRVMPASKTEMFQRFAQVMNSGQPATFDFKHQINNQTNWFQIQAVKLEDDLIVTFFDITSQKVVAEELQRKERLLSESMDLAHLGSWSWNISDNRVYWSEIVYRIYEKDPQTFEPTLDFFMSSILPEDQERVKTAINEAVQREESYVIEYRIAVKDQIKHIDARAIPKLGEDQTVQQYIGVIKDITLDKTFAAAQQKSERRSRRMEKAASSERLARTIAHEIRNPLTNISLATEQLRTEEEEDSQQIFLDMIARNTKRIEGLIKELMKSAQTTTLDLDQHNVNEVLEEALALAMDRIKLRNVQVVKHYAKKMPDITMDREKVRTALLNVLINAIEAVDDHDGKVTLETLREDEECIVRISDNGMGIPPEQLESLFDPFYTGKQKGLGLGLTTSLSIVNSHGGNIEVDSELDRGTTFEISFNR